MISADKNSSETSSYKTTQRTKTIQNLKIQNQAF